MSSEVRLAAWMPAILATPRTSPFGASPLATACAVAELTRTRARATARRSVAGFSPTSTIRARPEASRWVSSRIGGRGDGSVATDCDPREPTRAVECEDRVVLGLCEIGEAHLRVVEPPAAVANLRERGPAPGVVIAG